ncbi:MAG: sulfotransferase [Bacteroidales bacterium]|nr:MAG: sulfotransferase [Bacteroidales bacterium]
MKLIILNYIDRSGSTFLVNQLSRYPDILVFPEAGIFSSYLLKKPQQQFKADSSLKRKISVLLKEREQPDPWQLTELINRNHSKETSNIDVFIEMLVTYAEKHNNKAGIWVFKQPNMLSLLENSKKLTVPGFEIKYVCIIRDPRAVFNSQLKASQDFPELSFYKNPLVSAHTWLYFYNKAKSFSGNSDFHLVCYEQLIKQYKKEFEALMKFIGHDINSSLYFKKGELVNLLYETEKRLHPKINDQPDVLRIDAWKEELKPLMIKLIDKYTLKKQYIPEYKGNGFHINALIKLLAEIYYKLRIVMKIDKY